MPLMIPSRASPQDPTRASPLDSTRAAALDLQILFFIRGFAPAPHQAVALDPHQLPRYARAAHPSAAPKTVVILCLILTFTIILIIISHKYVVCKKLKIYKNIDFLLKQGIIIKISFFL